MSTQPAPWEIDVLALKDRLDRGEPVQVLDVRTPREWALCRIEGATLIPLNELPARLGEIDPQRETVVYCHVGGRSAHAVQFLRRHGFDRAMNLAGGIAAWADEVDPAMPRY